MAKTNYYEGRVHTIIYEDPDQAFYILKVLLNVDDPPVPGFPELEPPVTVRGHIPGLSLDINSWLSFEGTWRKHEKFGRQLIIQKAPVLRNGWDPDTIERVLTSNGVGERICQSIRAHFGDDGFAAALTDREKLETVPGLAKFSAAHVYQRWEATQAFFQTLGFLSELGLPAGKVRSIWRTFEDKAEQVLSRNPWALVQIDGITFQQADEIAMRLGLSLDNPGRMRGAVLYACKSFGSFGHLYMTTGQVHAHLSTLIPSPDRKQFAEALKNLHKEGSLVLDRETRKGMTAVYEPWPYQMEKESAALLLERMETAGFGAGQNDPDEYIDALTLNGPMTAEAAQSGDLKTTIQAAVEEWGSQSQMTLSPSQARGVVNALLHPVSILTGLPGTGKTTSLKAAVRVCQDAEIPFLLCAPTGIAAKRLSSLTGAEAFTIHRAFSAKGIRERQREATYAGIVGHGKRGKGEVGLGGEGEEWGFNEDNPHPAQVVIIDEASMVDQHLVYRILTCTAPNCRVVFVGDYAQLPSVGPGNVLRDLINSGKFPVEKLVTIFRQEDTSDIVFAAHAIQKGEVPKAPTKGDFVLLPVGSEEDAQSTIVKLAVGMYERRVNFQVLSPRHAGTLGVTKLNERLRGLLNPRSPGVEEVRLGKDTIREGDRVMVVQNNYDLGVFNGDVGKVAAVNRKKKTLDLKVFGAPPVIVTVSLKIARGLIRLAYACTVHKAQGLEYDVIILPVVESFRHQLQRNLYYTGVTRGRRRVILVGTHVALTRAVFNAKEDARNTMFLDRLAA